MRPKLNPRSSPARVAFSSVLGLATAFSLPGLARAVVQPLFINVQESIVWQTPSPFPGATLTAVSLFETGFLSNSSLQPTDSFGSENYSILYPPDPNFPPNPVEILLPAVQINWGDSIAWQFAGFLATAVATFSTGPCQSPAFSDGSNPCSVQIGRDLVGGFAPIDLTGGVFAFDSAVQIGTWEIKVSEVPEPATWMLLGAGFALVPVLQRWRAGREAA